MTSPGLCAALAATLAISGGAAMAQSQRPGQPGDPTGYAPPQAPPSGSGQAGDQQGYGQPPPPGDPSAHVQCGARSQQDREQRDNYADQRDDYNAKKARHHSQQAFHRRQLRVYERARRDDDMQFGPGAHEP
jgi:hypothetical protein